jgi:TPR repeat protein
MRLALVALLVTLCGGGVSAQPAAGATGPPASYGEAIRWYKKAARSGSAKAQYLLALMLETGQGRPRDPQRAARWYARAAAQGHARAQLRLGWLHQTGEGVPRDTATAAALYADAASQGLHEAAFNLGSLYEQGDGVPADPARAMSLYRQAAETGMGEAQLNLGLLLAARHDDRSSLKEGFLWLSRAAAQGVPGAGSARDSLRDTLSAAELAEVRRRLTRRRSEQPRR